MSVWSGKCFNNHAYFHFHMSTKSNLHVDKDKVKWRDCCSLHAVRSSVIYYCTYAQKNVIYLFYTIKIRIFYWRIWGAWKKKNKTTDVIIGMHLTSDVCMSFNRSQSNGCVTMVDVCMQARSKGGGDWGGGGQCFLCRHESSHYRQIEVRTDQWVRILLENNFAMIILFRKNEKMQTKLPGN